MTEIEVALKFDELKRLLGLNTLRTDVDSQRGTVRVENGQYIFAFKLHEKDRV